MGFQVFETRKFVHFSELGQGTRFLELLDWVSPSDFLHLSWVSSGTPDYRNHPDNKQCAATTVKLAAESKIAGVSFFGVGSPLETQVAKDAYAKSKRSAWLALKASIDARNITWFRPHYVFDPERPNSSLLKEIYDSLAEKRPARVNFPASQHDFIHASDVAEAIGLGIATPLRGLVEIGTGRSRTVKDFVESAGGTTPNSVRSSKEIENIAAARIDDLVALGWTAKSSWKFFNKGQ